MKHFFFIPANTIETPLNSSTLTAVITVLFIRSSRQRLPERHKHSYTSHPRLNEALRRPLKSKHNQSPASLLSISQAFNKWSSSSKTKSKRHTLSSEVKFSSQVSIYNIRPHCVTAVPLHSFLLNLTIH